MCICGSPHRGGQALSTPRCCCWGCSGPAPGVPLPRVPARPGRRGPRPPSGSRSAATAANRRWREPLHPEPQPRQARPVAAASAELPGEEDDPARCPRRFGPDPRPGGHTLGRHPPRRGHVRRQAELPSAGRHPGRASAPATRPRPAPRSPRGRARPLGRAPGRDWAGTGPRGPSPERRLRHRGLEPG